MNGKLDRVYRGITHHHTPTPWYQSLDFWRHDIRFIGFTAPGTQNFSVLGTGKWSNHQIECPNNFGDLRSIGHSILWLDGKLGMAMQNGELQIEAEPKATPLEFLQAVYRNEGLPLSARLKAAVEAAQYVHPRLAVTGVVDGQDIAALPEARLKRNAELANAQASPPKVIEHEPAEAPPLRRFSSVPDRRFRR